MSESHAARAEALEPRRMLNCYTLLDLGTLGGRESFAFDVNENNQVVGYAQTADGSHRAFRFEDANRNGIADAGEMRDLGVLDGDTASYAYGINSAGQVVGTSRSAPLPADGDERAVRFNPGAAPTDLGLGLGSNAYASNALDVNEGGAIVGGALSGLNYRPFVRSATGTTTSFTLPAPFNLYGEAHAVNFFGAVVGYSGSPAGDSGFLRSPDGTLTAVGHPDPALPYNYAWDVSDGGDVVGEGFNSAGDYRAFFRSPNGTVTDLGTLPGFGSSAAYGTNGGGSSVVGRVEPLDGSPGPTHAFLYREGVMHDLNDLVPPDTGWVITEARAVNSTGTVAGFGVAPDGSTRAVMLRPAPPAQVVGGHVFYNNSAFDGRDPAANAADDGAVPLDKEPLRAPGRPAYDANVTNYTKGINGIMVDLSDPGAARREVDFSFKVGTTDDPDTWPAAPPLASGPTRRPGAGAGGSDRYTFTWADGAIKNTWLQVIVTVTDCAGGQVRNVFYYGNLVGNVSRGGGFGAGALVVNAIDLYETRRSLYRFAGAGSASLQHPTDHNRDGRVNALDVVAVRQNYFTSLRLIEPPPEAAAPVAVALGAAYGGYPDESAVRRAALFA